MKLPPIICTLFIGKEYIGAYDNPYSILHALDEYVEGQFENLKDIDNRKLKLLFSVINALPTVITSIEYTEATERNDIKDMFDDTVEFYSKEIDEEYESQEEYYEDVYEG